MEPQRKLTSAYGTASALKFLWNTVPNGDLNATTVERSCLGSTRLEENGSLSTTSLQNPWSKADFDVNSFAVSADLGLHKRAYRPLCKTYGNMKRKVAYLIENDPKEGRCDYISKRVQKMRKIGDGK